MEAFGIRKKIRDVFGEGISFNNVIGAATVQSDCSRLLFSLMLWMDAFIVCMVFPIRIAAWVFGFVLGTISISTWSICGCCSKYAHEQYLATYDFVMKDYDDAERNGFQIVCVPSSCLSVSQAQIQAKLLKILKNLM
jgi:hypothetical protein